MSVGVYLVDGATTLYAWRHEPKTPELDWRGPVVGATIFFGAQEEAGYGHGSGFGH